MALLVTYPACHRLATRTGPRRGHFGSSPWVTAHRRGFRTGPSMTTRRHDAAKIAAADLTDELWAWPHLAKQANRHRSWAFELAARPGFPTPIGDGDRMWQADEVREFMRTWRPARPARPRPYRRAAATAPTATQPGQPLGMRLKPSRRAA